MSWFTPIQGFLSLALSSPRATGDPADEADAAPSGLVDLYTDANFDPVQALRALLGPKFGRPTGLLAIVPIPFLGETPIAIPGSIEAQGLAAAKARFGGLVREGRVGEAAALAASMAEVQEAKGDWIQAAWNRSVAAMNLSRAGQDARPAFMKAGTLALAAAEARRVAGDADNAHKLYALASGAFRMTATDAGQFLAEASGFRDAELMIARARDEGTSRSNALTLRHHIRALERLLGDLPRLFFRSPTDDEVEHYLALLKRANDLIAAIAGGASVGPTLDELQSALDALVKAEPLHEAAEVLGGTIHALPDPGSRSRWTAFYRAQLDMAKGLKAAGANGEAVKRLAYMGDILAAAGLPDLAIAAYREAVGIGDEGDTATMRAREGGALLLIEEAEVVIRRIEKSNEGKSRPDFPEQDFELVELWYLEAHALVAEDAVGKNVALSARIMSLACHAGLLAVFGEILRGRNELRRALDLKEEAAAELARLAETYPGISAPPSPPRGNLRAEFMHMMDTARRYVEAAEGIPPSFASAGFNPGKAGLFNLAKTQAPSESGPTADEGRSVQPKAVADAWDFLPGAVKDALVAGGPEKITGAHVAEIAQAMERGLLHKPPGTPSDAVWGGHATTKLLEGSGEATLLDLLWWLMQGGGNDEAKAVAHVAIWRFIAAFLSPSSSPLRGEKIGVEMQEDMTSQDYLRAIAESSFGKGVISEAVAGVAMMAFGLGGDDPAMEAMAQQPNGFLRFLGLVPLLAKLFESPIPVSAISDIWRATKNQGPPERRAYAELHPIGDVWATAAFARYMPAARASLMRWAANSDPQVAALASRLGRIVDEEDDGRYAEAMRREIGEITRAAASGMAEVADQVIAIARGMEERGELQGVLKSAAAALKVVERGRDEEAVMKAIAGLLSFGRKGLIEALKSPNPGVRLIALAVLMSGKAGLSQEVDELQFRIMWSAERKKILDDMQSARMMYPERALVIAYMYAGYPGVPENVRAGARAVLEGWAAMRDAEDDGRIRWQLAQALLDMLDRDGGMASPAGGDDPAGAASSRGAGGRGLANAPEGGQEDRITAHMAAFAGSGTGQGSRADRRGASAAILQVVAASQVQLSVAHVPGTTLGARAFLGAPATLFARIAVH